jgi:hypothetical protein
MSIAIAEPIRIAMFLIFFIKSKILRVNNIKIRETVSSKLLHI